MMNRKKYIDSLFSIAGDDDFEHLALEAFDYQAANNKVYSEFVSSLKIQPSSINSMAEIPFLPVEVFKTHKILSGEKSYQRIFTSSGTTSENTSRHFVRNVRLYEMVFQKIFNKFYGEISDYTILALLPSYLEREGSSLIYMMENLIAKTENADSGFYLNEFEKLSDVLSKLQSEKRKTILFGVTFALLDFISAHKISFPELIVMETGGMKGRRKEMIREEVHEILCRSFGVEKIHSEYGMTEILSQAYSQGDGIFRTPPWMKVIMRDAYDPFKIADVNIGGGINIIDLANIDSCAFLATQDLGKMHDDDSFEVLGRFDFSDIRGCNLLVN